VASLRDRYRLARGTTDLDEVLSWRPEAAFVLTPSDTHAALVRSLLEAEIDVFVEKPATLRSEETLALGELADRNGRILMVGFNRRFAPLHRRAREIWGGRRVGLCLLQKHRRDLSPGDLLSTYTDDAIHLIDLLRFYCGEATALETVQSVREGRLCQAISTASLTRGGHAVLTMDLEGGEWRETVSLHGEGASLDLEAFSSLRFTEGSDVRSWSEPYAGGWQPGLEARGFVGQVAHFFDCVASREPSLTSARESFQTQRLLEEMVASARA
jgi:virulence factor